MKTIGKGNLKGNPRLKHWVNDYPVFWPSRGCWQSKQKQCEPKLFGSQARFVCEAKCAGNHTRDSRAPDGWMRKRGGGQSWLQITVIWLSTDSRCSKVAEALYVSKKKFGTEKRAPQSVDGKVADENVFPPAARVSAKTRDENEWDTHDVWEFRR